MMQEDRLHGPSGNRGRFEITDRLLRIDLTKTFHRRPFGEAFRLARLTSGRGHLVNSCTKGAIYDD
jgi:hypothetical protein